MKKLILFSLLAITLASCVHTYEIEQHDQTYIKSGRGAYFLDYDHKHIYEFRGTDTELDDELQQKFFYTYEYPFDVKRVITRSLIGKK
jgi:hypothetical protein